MPALIRVWTARWTWWRFSRCENPSPSEASGDGNERQKGRFTSTQIWPPARAYGKLSPVHLRSVIATFALLAGLPIAQAQNDGVWTTATGGSWANAGNWLEGTIADGSYSIATFGIDLFPIKSIATFTLNGARTIGEIDLFAQTTPSVWSLNPGTGGTLTLARSSDFPAIDVASGLQMTITTVIAGGDGMEKFDAGTLVLTASNTYSGGTAVSGGTLLVNGVLTDANLVDVISGTLGGTGMISGPVTIESGATVAPGGSPGTLTISNSLTLQAGSKTLVDINASTLAHDLISGISTAAYGGTLVVNNLAGTPALGQTFTLFNASTSTGDFAAISPQLTGALRWKFTAATGTLSVVSTNSQPRFSSAIAWPAASVLLSVTNGVPGATNYLLATTNLAVPRTNWSRLATNVFDGGGNLVLTNTINSAIPQCFYLISLP